MASITRTIATFFLLLLPIVFGCTILNGNETQEVQCLHGNCIEGSKCQCYDYWEGIECNYSTMYREQPGLYQTDYFVGLIGFTAVFLYTSFKLYSFYTLVKQHNMKHLTLLLCVCGSFFRAVYYWGLVDVYDNRSARMMSTAPLFETADGLYYPFIISAYTCELFIWIEFLNAHTSMVPILMLPTTRKLFFSVLVGIFIFEVTVDIFVAIDKEISDIMRTVWLVYIAIVIVAEVIATLYVAIRIFLLLNNLTYISDKHSVRRKMQILTLISIATTGMLCVFFIIVVTGLSMEYDALADEIRFFVSSVCEIILVVWITWSVRPPAMLKRFDEHSPTLSSVEVKSSNS